MRTRRTLTWQVACTMARNGRRYSGAWDARLLCAIEDHNGESAISGEDCRPLVHRFVHCDTTDKEGSPITGNVPRASSHLDETARAAAISP